MLFESLYGTRPRGHEGSSLLPGSASRHRHCCEGKMVLDGTHHWRHGPRCATYLPSSRTKDILIIVIPFTNPAITMPSCHYRSAPVGVRYFVLRTCVTLLLQDHRHQGKDWTPRQFVRGMRRRCQDQGECRRAAAGAGNATDVPRIAARLVVESQHLGVSGGSGLGVG